MTESTTPYGSWRAQEALKELRAALDHMPDESPDFVEDLRRAVFEIIKSGQCDDYVTWMYTLRSCFPTEIIDALGTDEKLIDTTLQKWWNVEKFFDPMSKMELTFERWVVLFSNPDAKKLYDLFVEER